MEACKSIPDESDILPSAGPDFEIVREGRFALAVCENSQPPWMGLIQVEGAWYLYIL
jgi:hypothetical protein